MRRVLGNRTFVTILVAVATANLLMFAVQRWIALPLYVPSPSMQPALQRGDRILVRRSYDSPAKLAARIDRGDVLVFRAPQKGSPLVVKRVIGLPGESIEARNGLIAIDNEKTLVEKWIPESEREAGSPAADTVDIKRTFLEDDEVFLLGDNRDNSIDSRSFGPVKLDRVVGTVVGRYWPFRRWGEVDFI
ncbi:MAG: leader peptidase [Thermoleophilia bacterium]|nr:leader peptidase [Thermoleophilia bacterium]